MITIEEDPILISRADTCHEILTVAGKHANEFDAVPEGIFCIMASLVFIANQYGMKPRQLNLAIKKTREIVEKSQVIAGKDAGIKNVIFEAGNN